MKLLYKLAMVGIMKLLSDARHRGKSLNETLSTLLGNQED